MWRAKVVELWLRLQRQLTSRAIFPRGVKNEPTCCGLKEHFYRGMGVACSASCYRGGVVLRLLHAAFVVFGYIPASSSDIVGREVGKTGAVDPIGVAVEGNHLAIVPLESCLVDQVVVHDECAVVNMHLNC